jgi:hypothetical protein
MIHTAHDNHVDRRGIAFVAISARRSAFDGGTCLSKPPVHEKDRLLDVFEYLAWIECEQTLEPWRVRLLGALPAE